VFFRHEYLEILQDPPSDNGVDQQESVQSVSSHVHFDTELPLTDYESIFFLSLCYSRRPTIHPVSIHPFTADNLFEAGYEGNAATLKRILAPITSLSFGVTCAEQHVAVDKTRELFDSSVDEKGCSVIHHVLYAGEVNVDRQCEVLKCLLAAGCDPDRPDVFDWRCSHSCGLKSYVEAARLLFLCRPDMSALNNNDDTPLQAAQDMYNVRFRRRIH
jgi:hypothetical protein